MGIPAGAKAAPSGGRLRTPDSLTASASDAQGRASKNPHGATGFPRTAAFLHRQKLTDRTAVRHVAARSCRQKPPRNRGQIERLPDALLPEVSRLVEAPGISRDVPDTMLVYRTLSGNGSVLGFCEAVFWRSAFATRCWFTALSVVMGQCWLSVRLFFGGQHSRRDVGLPHSQW